MLWEGWEKVSQLLVGMDEFAYMVEAGGVEAANSASSYKKDMNGFLRTKQSVNL